MCVCVHPRYQHNPSFFLFLWAYYYSSVAFSALTTELNKISTEDLLGYFRETVYIFHIDIQVDFQISDYCDFFATFPK